MLGNGSKKTVLILLSTHNGEMYLREQLDSLYWQKSISFEILVRDDGSQDSTVEILNEYNLRYNNITILCEDNVGPTISFNKLMDYANVVMRRFDYYAFCDQDDVWDNDKLLCAIKILEKHKNNPLQLYTSSYKIVDEAKRLQYTRIFNYKHTLGEALIMINTLGCTQVFTKDLLKKAIKANWVRKPNSTAMPNHDGWMYLTAITLNAYIYYDINPHIYYRQHGNNVVGAKEASFLNRLKRIYRNKNIKSYISRILLEAFENIEPNNRQLLIWNSTYKNSVRKKLGLIFSKDMVTNSITLNIAYRILIILNWF